MEFRLQRIAVILLCTASGASGGDPGPDTPPLGVMRRAYLQEGKPYEVGVGALPTTILMPEPIEAFEANNITTQSNTVAPVYLQHRPGTRYFSVKALTRGTADLNVVLKNKLFSFRFYHTDNPVRTLTIEPPPAATTAGHGMPSTQISARRLYEILQEARTYFLVRDQHPELIRPIEVITPGKIIEYPGYRVVIDQVFRFERDDTIVIRAVFINDAQTPKKYLAQDVGLRVGRNLYWPSFAQLSGVIPGRKPAEISWEVSPEATSLTLHDSAGRTADLADRLTASLPEIGKYTLRASSAHGRSDSVRFTVRFPVSEEEQTSVLVSKSPGGFGVRKLTLRQPEPGQSFGWICYTGTADGQRANLSLDNEFSLVLPIQAQP